MRPPSDKSKGPKMVLQIWRVMRTAHKSILFLYPPSAAWNNIYEL